MREKRVGERENHRVNKALIAKAETKETTITATWLTGRTLNRCRAVAPYNPPPGPLPLA